jgi:trk system potassium uptake protein TrkA
MQVIIAGAGEIGRYIAEQVSNDGHDVTVIDHDEDQINDVNSTLDVQAVCGSASSAAILVKNHLIFHTMNILILMNLLALKC